MKRTVLFILIFPFLFVSCFLTKQNRQYRNAIKGTWELTEVAYTGDNGKYSSVLFGDADSECFRGSTWFFRSNNSTGYYLIPPQQGCTEGHRDIRWSVYEGNGTQQLQFKFIDQKHNDISGGFGFRLNIDYLDESTMKLHSKVNVEGKPMKVIYQFRKIQQ